MLQCELEDGRMLYVNMDRVTSISERKEGGLVLGQLPVVSGEQTWTVIAKFQILKTGAWQK